MMLRWPVISCPGHGYGWQLHNVHIIVAADVPDVLAIEMFFNSCPASCFFGPKHQTEIHDYMWLNSLITASNRINLQ